MKKIHVAGTALAGMLAVGAFQTKGVQSNPAGQTPAATASATPPAAPAGGSPVAPGGVQAGGQFNFAEDQDKTITLNLRPDQTAYTEVRIVYKRVQPNEDSSKDKKCPCAAEKKSKDDAAKKKNALRKEGDGKETKVPPA
ncbi:MAG TPA: hypothetical protein VN872_10920, partial [Candidatus Acidoferrum sp.]|nr:hypothetical protein [Candidatus Acidoferrum sp.]